MKTSEIIESIKSCGTVHECKSMKIFPNAFITDLKKNNKKNKQKKTYFKNVNLGIQFYGK